MEAARQKTVTRAPAPQPTPVVSHVVNLVAPTVQQKSNLRVSSPKETALACATAIRLADASKRILLVSTDPASNLDEMLGVAPRIAPRARFSAWYAHCFSDDHACYEL